MMVLVFVLWYWYWYYGIGVGIALLVLVFTLLCCRMSQLSRSGHYPHITDLDAVQCSLTRRDNTTAIIPVSEGRQEQFLCQYQAHCFALCQCCEFFACDCRMACPAGCSCLHDSAWKHNVISCAARNHTAVPPSIPMDATDVFLDGNNLGNFTSQVSSKFVICFNLIKFD